MLSNSSSEDNQIVENPVIDRGAPFFIAGLDQVCIFCNTMALEFKVEPHRMNYHDGWGQSFADTKSDIRTCYIRTTHIHEKTTEIPFALIKGNSPIITGLKVERNSKSVIMTQP